MEKFTAEVLKYAAFTDHGRGGNPAGVVLDADALTDAQMLAIAQAIGFGDGVLERRWPTTALFSPRAEVAFCGHATVATTVALAERDGTGARELATAAGLVTVNTDTDTDGGEPPGVTPRGHPTRLRRRGLRRTGGIRLGRRRAGSQVSGSQPTPATTTSCWASPSSTLAQFDYDFEALGELMEREGWTTVHAFVHDQPGHFRPRNAFPPGGVREDPATGAAAAAFGGYLRDLGLVAPPDRLTVRQGVELGTPSRIEIEVPLHGRQIRGLGSRHPAGAVAVRRAGAPVKRPRVDGPSSGGQ